ncbi:zinc-binding dehydrogenase [Trueperella sp.]|uniref:zinc-binding dehydrogenase n=1 Tax=Trueperella sp. TaxID=2699835 RepID=UPI0026316FEC|nr:zinc-binding dehydrogenase [Trueperella sp.]
MLPCFACESCQQGHFSLCEDYDYYGSRRHGAYAEYVCGPADLLLKVPSDLDLRAAAMVDPAAIALHAILRSKLTIGSKVAVTGGGGPIGLFAIQWAKLMGASEVVSIDVSKEKVNLAMEAGATSAVSDWQELGDLDNGFDVIVETSGARVVPDLAVSVLARHGEVVLIGIPNSDITISDGSWARLMRLEGAVLGSWNSFSAPFPGYEWRTTVQKLHSGDLKWKFMITHELGLDSVAQTIKQMYNREIHSSKVIFMPEKTRL